ncbi:MAG: putative membrane-bound dehydrogenase-like protein, partial [Mariniblastus sp.]
MWCWDRGISVLRIAQAGVIAIATMVGSVYAEELTAQTSAEIELVVRKQVETSENSGRFHIVSRAQTWDLSKTAVIVCDMWDYHHCLNAVRRVEEFAPRLNEVLTEARKKGATIIHAPSSCMAAYENHPARIRAVNTPAAENLPAEINAWCDSIPAEEKATYPIDQSDGGEDDDPLEHAEWAAKLKTMGRDPGAPWEQQTKLLNIDGEHDYISDQGNEVWNVLHEKGIDDVIVVGVHTNMCVLGRPFGIRQMVKNGKRVVLMRDMTDTMYNPKMSPFVSHFSGTDLIVEHIEKYVCPTITSDQLIGGKPFRFKNDSRPHVAIVMAEEEYKTAQTLPEFAAKFLNKDFRVSQVFASDSDRNDIRGLEVLDDADVAILSIRRRVLKPKQMDFVQRFVESGKPVIAIRTSSHAFSLRQTSPPDGYEAWPGWDANVLGGNYTGHYGNQSLPAIRVNAAQSNHPLLDGIELDKFVAGGSLYKTSPVADSATILLTGEIEGQPSEPVAWTYRNKHGGRSFYTSLGHETDFANPVFQQLLLNSVYRAAEIPSKSSPSQPSDKVSSLKVPDNLELDLLLAEPEIANPLYLNFDERGRLWLVEYRQYPWPAGLKLISRDSVWRNVYEPPFPPPPPHAADSQFRGKDKITIHEDTDGDGKFDKHTTFLDGLNLATAALKGRGGVFVMNPPYLVFYADQNNDDVPDSERPRILLSGFGIEDSHSIANSLRWGPDGWIYGAHGSTVSASIVRHATDGTVLADEAPVHSMGQFVWRYQPESHTYEVFAEGGGNAFGIEFDSKGRVYSGHNGGNTRGFHYVQGGYSLKNFGKHGSLSNPYAFGYYDAMKHPAVERFTHTFEIYEADSLPLEYRGKLFGVSPNLHNTVHSRIFPHGSTRQTEDIGLVMSPESGEKDNWFTPVDIQTGPDGAIYVADWYSVQSNHYRNHEGQTNPDLGRVYRLRGKQHDAMPGFDLGKESSEVLIEKYLTHPNRWFRETALRVLGDRKDASITTLLRDRLAASNDLHSLESLWALNLCGGFDEPFAREILAHSNPFVRAWTVRLLGDGRQIESTTAKQLADLAESESNVEVRLQLACSARRFPTAQALPILGQLLQHSEDATDPLIPKMIWWSVEAHANDRSQVVSWLEQTDLWRLPLAVSANLTENLMRRYAMQGRQLDLETCGELLRLAPDATQTQQLANGFVKAFSGRGIPSLPDTLIAALSKVEGPFAVVLGIRGGDAESIQTALEKIVDRSAPRDVRLQYVRAIGEVKADTPECIS